MAQNGRWYRFAGWFCRTFFFRPLGRLEVRGLENVPAEGPLLVAPIHTSHIDPPLVGSVCPRILRFMAKKELFFFPLGPLIRSLGAFPVGRGEGDSAAIRLTLAELERGAAILIFPEGTRGDGRRLGDIQIGTAMIAKKSGAKILPVGIAGAAAMLPKGKLFPRRAKLVVCFGPAFTYQDTATGSSERENRTLFVKALKGRLHQACTQAGLELDPLD